MFFLCMFFCNKGRLVATTELDVGTEKSHNLIKIWSWLNRFMVISYSSRNSSLVHGNNLISVSYRPHDR